VDYWQEANGVQGVADSNPAVPIKPALSERGLSRLARLLSPPETVTLGRAVASFTETQRGERVTAANRQGARFMVVLCAATSLYFVWIGLTSPAFFQLDSSAAYLGAVLFAVFTIMNIRVARHPERYDVDRPSAGYYVGLIFEAVWCLGAVLIGVDWLIERIVGPGNLADEMQRTALWVFGGITVLLLVIFARRGRPRAQIPPSQHT
jgi:hypothetical protein